MASLGQAMCRRRLAASLVALASVSLAAEARAGDPAAARELLKRGYLLAQEGKCEEAVPLFEESLRLDVKAITLINTADCEEKLGRLSGALGHWVDARARAKVEGNAAVEAEAENRAKSLEPRLARLVIVVPRASPAGTVVTRDGITLGPVSLGIETPVDPGPHVVVVGAPGRAEATVRVMLAEGETKRVEAAPGDAVRGDAGRAPEGPEARGTSPLVWVGFGVGAAGLAVGSVTGLLAMSRATDVERACPGGLCPDAEALDRVDGGRTLGNVSTVAFVVGGAGGALGATMLQRGAPRPPPPRGSAVVAPPRALGDRRAPRPSVRAFVAPTGAGVTGAF